MITRNSTAKARIATQTERQHRAVRNRTLEAPPKPLDVRRFVNLAGATCSVLALLPLALASCGDQRRPQCTIGRGSIVFVYRPVAPPACGAALPGEGVAAGVYYDPRPDNNMPDYARTSIALQPDTITTNMTRGPDPDTTHPPRSVGYFAAPEPESDNFCRVEAFTPTVQAFPEEAEETPADGGAPIPERPATQIQYEWGNLRVYVTAANQGNQVISDLAITTDGCRIEYTAVGLWPSVSCALENGELDPTLCSPYADPAKNRGASGISPDLVTTCHPELKRCVLATDPPAMQ